MEHEGQKSMSELVDAAFQQAAQKVIERAVQYGIPVIAPEAAIRRELKKYLASRQQTDPRREEELLAILLDRPEPVRFPPEADRPAP